MTTKIIYEGGLRTDMEHVESATHIKTDAPKDNQGNGAAFSPTDLMASSLGTCIVTTMAIYARNHNIFFENVSAEVTKIMIPTPRKVGEIKVDIYFPEHPYSEKEKSGLENIAHTCPVARSLHPDVLQTVRFFYGTGEVK